MDWSNLSDGQKNLELRERGAPLRTLCRGGWHPRSGCRSTQDTHQTRLRGGGEAAAAQLLCFAQMSYPRSMADGLVSNACFSHSQRP